MRSNLILLATFLLGVVIGAYVGGGEFLEAYDVSSYLLYLLMFTVGLSVGNDSETIRGFRELPWYVLLLPFLTIIGSLFGGAVATILLSRSLFPTLAIASGMGYYSLSSIIITEKLGLSIGVIALLANIFRELITIIFAPAMSMHFGPYAPIASGGATTMDVTLPAILTSSGKEYLVTSIYHGFVCDLSVPILVSLFVGL